MKKYISGPRASGPRVSGPRVSGLRAFAPQMHRALTRSLAVCMFFVSPFTASALSSSASALSAAVPVSASDSMISASALISPVIYINQVGFDSRCPKMAVIGCGSPLVGKSPFTIVRVAPGAETGTGTVEYTGRLSDPQQVEDWAPGKWFYQADFSALRRPGKYQLRIRIGHDLFSSDIFQVGENELAKLTLRGQARMRADHLAGRMTAAGYFRADETGRPFWHASDAGLPVVALTRYLDKEDNPVLREQALRTIRSALYYNLRVTAAVSNPFGYARQTFIYKDSVHSGFFIPHDNETGWWWQGENARLASLATDALTGSRLLYPSAVSRDAWQSSGLGASQKSRNLSGRSGRSGPGDSLAGFASRQLSWILGCNPYSMCFMYGFGRNNVPYMSSSFGHGSGKGGISNGITGKDGRGDGSGIDFKTSAEGNEWRWTEQWLPHAAWFLQAITALAAD